MGKQKEPPTEPDPPQPPAPEGQTGTPPPAPPAKSGADRDLVKSVLAELAQSGELFGGTGQHDPAGGDPPDLEAAIARVLDRRDAESKARQTEQERDATLAGLKEAVGKGLGRARRWFEPASPWGE